MKSQTQSMFISNNTLHSYVSPIMTLESIKNTNYIKNMLDIPELITESAMNGYLSQEYNYIKKVR